MFLVDHTPLSTSEEVIEQEGDDDQELPLKMCAMF